MSQSRVKIVVFDIGNVLLHWDPRLLYRTIFADSQKMEWFLRDVCSPEFNAQLDEGRKPLAEAIAALARQFPKYADEIHAYDERWLETVGGPIGGSVAVLHELRRAGVPVYAITNFSAEKFAVACQTFDFLRELDGIVVSGVERILKPQPEIYHLLLDRYGLAASDCLFIDDAAQNVDGARAVGMQAHHFTGPDAMRAELVRHGLFGGTAA